MRKLRGCKRRVRNRCHCATSDAESKAAMCVSRTLAASAISVVSDLTKQLRFQNKRRVRNGVEAKQGQQAVHVYRFNARYPGAGPGEQYEQFLRGHAGGAERCQPRITVPLGEAAAIGPNDQRNVSKRR